MNDETIGGRELSAWQVAPGVVWVQTRSAVFARKLSQRRDARLVVRGVAGSYLRTFEFQHGLAWARRLIRRYLTKTGTPTNGKEIAPACPARRQKAEVAPTPPASIRTHGSAE